MKRSRLSFRKIGVALIGFPVIIAGIVLLVLPGPGLLLIAIGLAILAAEYEWARRHHLRIRKMITDLAKNVRRKNNKRSNKNT